MKLEEANKLSLQEAIDYALDKIVQQGKRCINHNTGHCLYGNSEDNHCFVGWLLDKDNDALMGHTGDVENLVSDGEINKNLPTVIYNNVSLFSALQDFHDKSIKSTKRNILKELEGAYPNLSFNNPNWEHWINIYNVSV